LSPIVEAVQPHDVKGYEYIERAAAILKAVIDDLFDLPGAAQDRAGRERDRLGEQHGDDLFCGCWSAAEAGTAILELSGRHVDAIVHLSAEHPAFAPSASVLARAALEGLLRVTWLLTPSAAVDREQRWIALKREEVKFYKNAGLTTEANLRDCLDDLDGLSEVIGGSVVARLPSAEALAKEYGRTPLLYDFFYRFNSQQTHATVVGAGTFERGARNGWAGAGGEGEWIEAEFWGPPFAACWEGLKVALPAYRDLLVPEQPLPSLEREEEFLGEMRSVPANYQAKKDAARFAPHGPPDRSPSTNRAQRRAAAKKTRRSN
jgi:hypothetical protein